MSLTQLHPEELFDKEARGTLTADERTRLERHVAQCSACNVERMLRADFAAENEAPLSYADLIAGALGAVGAVGADGADGAADIGAHAPLSDAPASPDAPEPEPTVEPITRARRDALRPAWRRVALLMAAALALVCTAAVASPQGRSFVRRAGTMLSASDDVRERAPTPPPAAKHPSASAVNPAVTTDTSTRAELPAPTAPAAEAPVSAAAAPTEAAPAASLPRHLAPTAAPRPASVAVAVAAAPPAGPNAPVPTSEAPPADAATLFALGNARRSAGDLTGSLAAYGELTRRYPASREAATGRALSGRVLLANKDARGALAEFDAYLRSGRGELREEALVGRARALGLQNLRAAEAEAWQALLAAYPASASAEHARLRLASLSGVR